MKNKYLLIFLFFLIPFLSLSQAFVQDLTKNWEFRKKTDTKWYPASVPGTVHTDLLSNKLIPDPFCWMVYFL